MKCFFVKVRLQVPRRSFVLIVPLAPVVTVATPSLDAMSVTVWRLATGSAWAGALRASEQAVTRAIAKGAKRVLFMGKCSVGEEGWGRMNVLVRLGEG